jgi:hypothetical protein
MYWAGKTWAWTTTFWLTDIVSALAAADKLKKPTKISNNFPNLILYIVKPKLSGLGMGYLTNFS